MKSMIFKEITPSGEYPVIYPEELNAILKESETIMVCKLSDRIEFYLDYYDKDRAFNLVSDLNEMREDYTWFVAFDPDDEDAPFVDENIDALLETK